MASMAALITLRNQFLVGSWPPHRRGVDDFNAGYPHKTARSHYSRHEGRMLVKAVVLCGGEGTRMRPFTYSQPKHLISIANRPAIEWIIDTIRDGGIDDIAVVVSPSTELIFRDYLQDGSCFSVNLSYIVQESPKGLAHAVQCAEEFVGSEPFLVYLGDNLVEHGVTELIRLFESQDCRAALSLFEVRSPSGFGVACISSQVVVRVVEKPAVPPSNLAICGIYVFSSDIFSAIERIEPSARGELEITDAIQRLIDDGGHVVPHVVTGWWKDVGKPKDFIEANQLLLESLELCVSGKVDSTSVVVGQVRVSSTARVERSRLQGPLLIGDESRVLDSSLRPNVSIGRGVKIRGCTLRDCVVLDGARMVNLGPIQEAFVGCNSDLEKREKADPMSFVIGDGSLIRL